VPAAAGVKEPERTTTLRPASELVEVKAGGPAQEASSGPKSWKVTVPVGLEPPLTVAVSKTAVPTGPPAEGWVASAGAPWVTVTCSSWQPERAGVSLASPP